MKNLLKMSLATFALAGISSAALATTPGVYVGGGLGYNHVEQSGWIKAMKPSNQNNNLAARAFVGYNINQNFGVEGGYNYFGQVVSKGVEASGPSIGQTEKFSNQLQATDLVGKAYLPISDSGFNAYVLGGAAYVHSSIDYTGPVKSSSSSNKVLPKYGVGVSYDVPNSPVTVALEGTRIQGNGSHSATPNIDTGMLTVSYTFDGDTAAGEG